MCAMSFLRQSAFLRVSRKDVNDDAASAGEGASTNASGTALLDRDRGYGIQYQRCNKLQ